ncbi:MAG: PadR family transcriptional regulator [Nocardioidaceae bacterium]|nr:PadR family transcriptional regulator [Nocardioidaceae bacterium]
MKTLGYALLGQLAREPLTGYDLTRKMDSPIGYMWSAHHSQVYPMLSDLERDGYVRHRVVSGRGPRDTKLYTITAKGKRALRSWIASTLAPPESRSELMLRVRALWVVSPDVARGLIKQARDHHSDRLARYVAEERDFSHDDRTNVALPAFAAYATLTCGISNEQHMLSWCDWLLGHLSAAATSAEGGRSVRRSPSASAAGPVPRS